MEKVEPYEIERDAACRGYWVYGLKELQERARESHSNTEDAFFIPDKVLWMIKGD